MRCHQVPRRPPSGFVPLLTLTLVLTHAVVCGGQGKPGGGGGGKTGISVQPSSLPNFPTSPLPGPMFITGTVALEGGAAITDTVVIQSVCHGDVRNEAYSDSKGNFTLNLGDRTRDAVATADEAESPLGNPGGSGRLRAPRDLRDCALRAALAGFRSDVIELRGKVHDQGDADVGTIMLHRMAQVEGFTVSATTAAAPSAARKEYEKGKEDAQKGKWESAAKRFAKAVEIYPKYAAAWCELGRVQLQRNDEPAARISFGRAQEADSKFITPYAELANLALKAKDWKELAQTTETLLALDPVDYPQRWYYNAAANYYLDDLDKAEKSAARCIALDEQHRIPRVEYLLGMVLAKKKDYSGAAAHIKNYIRLAPNATDLEAAQQQLAGLEMSATVSQNPSK